MECIEIYLKTAVNYDKTIFFLNRRFGKPDFLNEVSVRELIKIKWIISKVNTKN